MRNPATCRPSALARAVLNARAMPAFDLLWEPLAVTILAAVLLIASF